MAIKQKIELPTGITVLNAYIRVEEVFLTKTKMSWKVKYYTDADKPAFKTDTQYGDYSLDNGNPIAQAYRQMKTLPEFAGATDC